VTCGEDNAKLRVQGGCEVSHARRWHHAESDDVHAAGGQPGYDSGLEELARGSRIAADDG
jgi:hypothetical protein